MRQIKYLIGILMALAGTAYADDTNFTGFNPENHPFYVSVSGGIMQAQFSQTYLDQTDVFRQSISESVQQNGYTGGIAIGYSKRLYQQYFVGAELSANLDSHTASYQAGASTAAFSDTTQIKNHFDLTFVPGILLTDTLEGYAKIGITLASVQDNLSSPAGYYPVMTVYNNNNNSQNAIGAVLGLGIKKFITPRFSAFIEGTYRDYGTTKFSDFENFTATYTHSAHIYHYATVAGVAYNFL